MIPGGVHFFDTQMDALVQQLLADKRYQPVQKNIENVVSFDYLEISFGTTNSYTWNRVVYQKVFWFNLSIIPKQLELLFLIYTL